MNNFQIGSRLHLATSDLVMYCLPMSRIRTMVILDKGSQQDPQNCRYINVMKKAVLNLFRDNN